MDVYLLFHIMNEEQLINIRIYLCLVHFNIYIHKTL